jgi:hypothetical protein
VSTTFALLFTPAPAMIFIARDCTSTAVRVAFSFRPEARSRLASPSMSSAEVSSFERRAASFCWWARESASSARAISCLARPADSPLFIEKKTPPAIAAASSTTPIRIRTSVSVET